MYPSSPIPIPNRLRVHADLRGGTRLVQTTLKGPLANEILFGKLGGGGTAHIELKAGEIVIECEPVKPAGSDEDAEADAPKPPPKNKLREPVN